ncbi:MAG: DUF4252 domain-containing protein [Marinifilaceae bacterium]
MKKTLIILAISLITLMASAQVSFKKFNDTYGNMKGISIVQLDKELIDLYKRDKLSEKDLAILKNIEKVNIFTCSMDDGYEGDIEVLTKKITSSFSGSKYKLVKSKVDNDGFSKVYIKNTDNKKTELIVLRSETKEKTSFIVLGGDIKLSNIYRLTYALRLDGLKDLKEVNKSFSSRSHKRKRLIKQEKFFKGIKDNAETNETIDTDKEHLISYDRAMDGLKINLNSSNFDTTMDNFEEILNKCEKKIEEMIDNSFYMGEHSETISVKPGRNSICLLDGVKVKNKTIKKLKSGINRVHTMRKNKDNEVFTIVTSHKKIGKYITPKGGRKIGQSELKFIYNGETYTYSEKEKIFPGYIINGKKKESLYTKWYSKSEIIQIRPISKIEKKAFKTEKDRIVIETK